MPVLSHYNSVQNRCQFITHLWNYYLGQHSLTQREIGAVTTSANECTCIQIWGNLYSFYAYPLEALSHTEACVWRQPNATPPTSTCNTSCYSPPTRGTRHATPPPTRGTRHATPTPTRGIRLATPHLHAEHVLLLPHLHVKHVMPGPVRVAASEGVIHTRTAYTLCILALVKIGHRSWRPITVNWVSCCLTTLIQL